MKEITTKRGGHKILLYDDVEEMSVVRYNKFNQSMMLSSVLGDGSKGLKNVLSSVLGKIECGDLSGAKIGIKNAFLSIDFSENAIDPKSNALAIIVHSIDGVEKNDVSDDGIASTRKELDEIFSVDERSSALDAVKKKLTETLLRFFRRHKEE